MHIGLVSTSVACASSRPASLAARMTWECLGGPPGSSGSSGLAAAPARAAVLQDWPDDPICEAARSLASLGRRKQPQSTQDVVSMQ